MNSADVGDCTWFDGDGDTGNNGANSTHIGSTDGLFGSEIYSDSLSIAAWVAIETTPATDGVIFMVGRANETYDTCSGHSDGDCTAFQLAINPNRKVFFGNIQGADSDPNDEAKDIVWSDTVLSLSSTTTPEKTWYYIVATFDANLGLDEDPDTHSARIYVNGEEDGVGTVFTPRIEQDANAGWAIGGYIGGGGEVSANMFKGYLDDVRVWNRALGAGEISTLYAINSNGG